MRKPIPLFAITLMFCINLIFSFKAGATHCAGGELVYEWVSDSTYRFFFKFYRDCTGAVMPQNANLCVGNTCKTGPPQSIPMKWWTGNLPGGRSNGDPLDPGCAQYPTKCGNPSSSIPGFEEGWYSTLFTVPSRCSLWRFSVSVSSRNPSTNLYHSAQGADGIMYVETTLNNEQFQGNSSPTFTIPPLPYICVNSPFTYNNGVVDKDGDSTVIEIVQPRNNSCQDKTPSYINTAQGITYPANPIFCNNTFVINPQSGQFTFTASATGAQTLTTRASEYRNGILVGQVSRDVQVQVLACDIKPSLSTNPLPGSLVNSKITDGTIVTYCGSDYLQFCFEIKASDTTAILIATDNHEIATPGATITYSQMGVDSIRGCLTWALKASDTGFKNLVVFVKDSTCRPPGIAFTEAFSYPIKISTLNKLFRVSVKLSKDRDTVCQYDSLEIMNIDSSYNEASYTWELEDGGTASGENPYNLRWETKGLKMGVITINNKFCDSADTVRVYVKDFPVAGFATEENVCLNEPTEILPLYCDRCIYTWKIDEVAIDDDKYRESHTVSWNKTGTKPISLQVMGLNGCGPDIYSGSLAIRSPVAGIHDISRKTYCYGDTIYPSSALQPEGYRYLWTPSKYFADSTAPVVSFVCDHDAEIRLRVTDEWDCESETTMPVKTDACCKVFFPDAFTPNGDGHNDVFRLVGAGHYQIKAFIIKNRWGQTIFETNDPRKGWDGIFNGKLQDPGAYFYYLSYYCPGTNKEFSQKGLAILVR